MKFSNGETVRWRDDQATVIEDLGDRVRVVGLVTIDGVKRGPFTQTWWKRVGKERIKIVQ